MGAKHNAPHGSHVWGYCVVLFYNEERNHQGLANKIIRPEFPVFPVEGEVCCRKRLGGLLRYYYRQAAQNQLVRVCGQYG